MKKYSLFTLLAVFALALCFFGCGASDHAQESASTEHAGHDHDEGKLSQTVWDNGLEVFAEWDELAPGESSEWLIHITDLATFNPVESGTVTILLNDHGRQIGEGITAALVRPGIFKASVIGPNMSHCDAQITLAQNGTVREVLFEGEHDHGDHEDHADHDEHDEHDKQDHGAEPDVVNFLKEQQWQLEFATEEVKVRAMSDNIRALGEIKAAGVGEAEVFAPFDGVLMPDPAHGIVRPGQSVAKGEILARIAPSGGGEGGWTKLVNDYRLAQSEYDRVNRLFEEGAVASKRLDEARLDLENKKSRVSGTLGGASVDFDELASQGEHFYLRAPLSGVITDIHLRFGQHVEIGEHLFNIIDPSKIWLEALVPMTDAGRLDEVSDATFTLSGSEINYRVSELGGRLISVSTLLDPATRRIPVIFELPNDDANFRPGSYAQVYLKTRSEREAPAVPQSSILDEDGTPVVYVQLGGEEFARKVVKTGAKDEGYVEIIEGLHAGERVVSVGAYKVRLASLKISADAGHAGHVH